MLSHCMTHAAGELRSVGDKGHKLLLASILPRLSQFEALPAALVPQLIQLSSTDDRWITVLPSVHVHF